MEERLIELDTAKLGKEKGFDIPVMNYINANGTYQCIKATEYYYCDGLCDGVDNIGGVVFQNYNGLDVDDINFETHGKYYNSSGIPENYSAPTQSLLQTWLREIHDIHIQILIHSWSERTYCYKIHSEKAYIPDSSKFVLDSDVVIGKYVDVLEKALHHGLKLIKE